MIYHQGVRHYCGTFNRAQEAADVRNRMGRRLGLIIVEEDEQAGEVFHKMRFGAWIRHYSYVCCYTVSVPLSQNASARTLKACDT